MKQKFWDKVKAFWGKVSEQSKKHPFIKGCIISFLLLIVCESLCRHSVIDAFKFIVDAPYAFYFNYLIILLTISIAEFFPKESFAVTIASAFWFVLSFINFVVLFMRATPFSAIDFSIVINMLGIIDIYLNLFQLALIGGEH